MALSLYVHFPFCIQKCLYCDFNSTADSTVSPGDYVAALEREMELRARLLAAPPLAETLYFGGGTPSLMEPALVGRLIEAASKLLGLSDQAEITIEANPGILSLEKLKGYRTAGVNRLSLGIQSFDDMQLSRLGRAHNARQALEAFAAARTAGFCNIGIDLIHSLPGQSNAEWLDDLKTGVGLAPEHISAYALSVEEGTPFYNLAEAGNLDLPDEDSALAMFTGTIRFLDDAGFEQYEISNFARQGCRSRHNGAYWRRIDYLGFGAGAHSFSAAPGYGSRWKNREDVPGYLQQIVGGVLPEEERSYLDRRDAMAEWLFLGLRVMEGIDGVAFREEFGISLEEAYKVELPQLLTAGMLEWQGRRLRVTEQGLPLFNQIVARFL